MNVSTNSGVVPKTAIAGYSGSYSQRFVTLIHTGPHSFLREKELATLPQKAFPFLFLYCINK
jgi:hypothetical protein